MKQITKTIHKTYKQDTLMTITNVVHDLPTWMFPEFFGQVQKPCPVCHKEMRLNIAHGQYIEKCSFIEMNGFEVSPIHTECYNKIEEINPVTP